MSNTKVEMLDTVEDTWAEPKANDKGGVDVTSHTDSLQKGAVVSLPDEQAKRLIKQGFAKKADG